MVAFIAVILLSLVVGFGAAWLIKSPAQLAAESAPPPPSDLTAQVEEGALTQSVVFAGTVSLGNRLEYSAPSPDGLSAIVTRIPVAAGATVTAGAVLLEVADRPLILLPGEIPLLRDLHRGDKGADVSRLQQALQAFGAPVDGTFGRTTEQAIRTLYQQAGYAPPLDSAGRPEALRSELAFAPNGANGRVISVDGSVGETAGNPAVVITTAPAVVTAELSQVDADLLAVGDAAAVSGGSINTELKGTISVIGTLTKMSDGGFRVPVAVSVEGELPPDAVGSAVDVSIDVADDSAAGLLVPLAALYSRADGSTYVVVVADDRHTQLDVVVEETGDGAARVNDPSGKLAAGDLVLIGQA